MLDKPQIIERLNSIHEHKMAKDIFVPVLKKMELLGVKYTGGPDEQGNDIEYYELTEPEKDRSYVGVQFKKGNLVYSSGGSKNSVKEVRNQAEEAFEKEIHDIDTHAVRYISRFVVAVTGDINETARKFIGRARQKGSDRRIDYWTGDRLAEYVQEFWMDEFIDYFGIDEKTEELEEDIIVDSDYIVENYGDIIEKCSRLRSTIDSTQWRIVSVVFRLGVLGPSTEVTVSKVLLELESTEDTLRADFEHLLFMEYIDIDDRYIRLLGEAALLDQLFNIICEELNEAEEMDSDPLEILEETVDID